MRFVNKAVNFVRAEYTGNFLGDCTGGVTAAVVALPLALAFAIASGVEPKYGVFTAIVAGFIAAIFGGSRVQVSGPTGGMAAVLVTVIAQFGYEKVVLMGLMAGVFQIAAGLLRLGRFVKMLPFPLVTGFTMGISIVILGGQIDHALGLPITHVRTEYLDRLLETVGFAFSHGVNLACVAIAAGTMAILVPLNRKFPRLPAAILCIVVSSVAVWALGLDVPRIQDIPQHLPSPKFPLFSWEMVRELLRPAAIIAALGGIESLLAAVVADNVLGDGSRHQPNRELVGQGLANVGASIFGGIPCTGAIARTAVNIRSGGRTRLAAVIHSVVLLSAMLFLAPLAVHIPIAALAGVLIVTAIRMVEWREIRWLMKAPRSDIAIMTITVLVTVFTDLVLAVEFGLVTAAVLFIKKMSDVVPLAVQIESGGELRLAERVRVFRIPGPLFWGDSHAMIEALDQVHDVHVVILKMQLVSHIDASGASMLREARVRLQKRGIRLFLVDVPVETMNTLRAMGIEDEITKGNIFPSLEDAKIAAFKQAS